jgi:hypothetical protein
VKARTRNIFTVTGLDVVFEFVEDQFLALAGLQMAGADRRKRNASKNRRRFFHP